MKVTDEMVAAYAEAWEAKRKEIGRGIAAPGTKTRAGLEVAIAASRSEALADAWDEGLSAGQDRWSDSREFGDPPVNPYREER